MEVLVRCGTICADVVKSRHARLAAKLVDKLGLPEEHDVLLILCGFFDFSSVEVSRLLLLNFENLAEGPTAQFLDDLEATLQDLLILLQHAAFRYLFKLSL